MSRTGRRRKPLAVRDYVIRGCLALIRRGEMSAVGVLADRMEEEGLPHARTVRRMWNRYQRRFRFWTTADLTRRRFTAREVIAWDRASLRGNIARLFGRKWRFPGMHKFM